MRGKIGGEDQGSEGGDGESVKGVNESFTPCLLPLSAELKQYNLQNSIYFLPIMWYNMFIDWIEVIL
jgi:hypothetical protein